MSIRPEKHVWDKTWGQDSKKVQISHTDKMIFNYLINEINPKDSDVIEMGCGRGVLSYLMSKYNPNTITLMDFSKEALARAKNLFQDICKIITVIDRLRSLITTIYCNICKIYS